MSEQEALNNAMAGIGLMTQLFILAAIYVYLAFCISTIAKKTGMTRDLWMAWVPILQLIPLLRVAGKPEWWIILYFIPCVNLVINIIVWMRVAEARGKPSWLGILMIVPCVNLIIPAYLAFSD